MLNANPCRKNVSQCLTFNTRESAGILHLSYQRRLYSVGLALLLKLEAAVIDNSDKLG